MTSHVEGNNIPFLSIIRLVTARVVQMSTPTSKVAVLGGNGCMRSGLYQKSLADAGVTPFTLDAERQSLVMKVILAHVYAAKKRKDTLLPQCAQRLLPTLRTLLLTLYTLFFFMPNAPALR